MIYQKNNQSIQFAEDYHYLSKQLDQYKKITQNLKKKIRAKDKKINYLVSYMDKFGLSSPSSQQLTSLRHRGNSDIIHQKKQITHKIQNVFTQNKKKQKQNLIASIENSQQFNIFKGSSSRALVRVNKQQIKLPSLEKKGMFADQIPLQQHQLKQKIIRIPVQKLKPLKAQDLKRKFQQRFKNSSPLAINPQ